jgi:hypothetical protein
LARGGWSAFDDGPANVQVFDLDSDSASADRLACCVGHHNGSMAASLAAHKHPGSQVPLLVHGEQSQRLIDGPVDHFECAGLRQDVLHDRIVQAGELPHRRVDVRVTEGSSEVDQEGAGGSGWDFVEETERLNDDLGAERGG